MNSIKPKVKFLTMMFTIETKTVAEFDKKRLQYFKSEYYLQFSALFFRASLSSLKRLVS